MSLGKIIDFHANPKERKSAQIQRELVTGSSHNNSNNYKKIITYKWDKEGYGPTFVPHGKYNAAVCLNVILKDISAKS